MMQRLVYIILLLPLAIFLLMSIVLWRGLTQDPHHIPSPLINHPIPAFTAYNLLNQQQVLSQQQFQGHVSLLNVFATWCVSCRIEHPLFIDIAHNKVVQIIGLNYKDQRHRALSWLQHYGNPYSSIINDPEGRVAMDFGVYGTPETFLIDAQGIIRDKYLGPISPELWQHELLPQIKKWVKAMSVSQ